MVNQLFLVAALVSSFAFAGQTKQFMDCTGAPFNGVKNPLSVQAYVINSKQVEAIKIQYKSQIWVNELNRVQGQPYDDGIINNHVMFVPKSDEALGVVLPNNFQMFKKLDGFLSVQKGDDISFAALTCTLQ